MLRFAGRLACVLFIAVASAAAGPRDVLSRARQLYNSRQYDQAIDAAREAARTQELADAASLVLARAFLERFRQSNNPGDLNAAREALKQVRSTELGTDDRVEFSIALGESLYLDDQAGAAAEQFDLALARVDSTSRARRERLLDWWASALDRQAQLDTSNEAHVLYTRMVDRMSVELRRDPASTVASYWLVAAARGSGDLARAWDAAIAAWVRAPRGERGASLRADLDRIVLQAIIPERARQIGPTDPQSAAAGMRTDWERFKKAWAIQ